MKLTKTEWLQSHSRPTWASVCSVDCG